MNPQDIWDCFGGIIHKISQARADILDTSSNTTDYAYLEKMIYSNERSTSKFSVVVSIIMTEDENLAQQYTDELDAWLKTKNLQTRM